MLVFGGTLKFFSDGAYLGFPVMLIVYRELTSSGVGWWWLCCELEPLHLPLFIFTGGHNLVILSSVQAN